MTVNSEAALGAPSRDAFAAGLDGRFLKDPPTQPSYGAAHPNEGGQMEQRLSLITLGVADVDRAREFYEALGWKTDAEPGDDVVFFQAGGMVVALWDRAKLAEDSAVSDSPGWGGVTLAYNVSSPQQVDAVIEEARRAGATIGREGDETFWGGYSGVFIDPGGHPWEVAHNPRWTVHDDGTLSMSP
jgi:uncharacterized protein